jgi:CelD/BcsL family acetyltransferase involved in cellulose biosynthesis
MKIELIQARELPPDLIARWDEIVGAAPELASPYFRPQFTQAVAALRPHVEVGVLREGNAVAGFFPFERAGAAARPVGGKLSDYQGVIAAADVNWRVEEILQGCRLRAWEFTNLLASHQQLAPHFACVNQSRRLDLRGGFEAYAAARKAAAKMFGEMLRKLRKLQRESAVRFEWHTAEPAVFEQLLAWKSDQYRRSGLTDLFAYGWIVSLLKAIWQMQEPQFRGLLSALYIDDKIAAVHFGMQSGNLLHSWFPAYDVALSKSSPGAALLLLIAQHAAEHGVSWIELGVGDEPYKLAVASDSVPLAEGVVETRPAKAALRATWRQARDWVRRSPLREPARAPIRWLRRMREWLELR